MGLQTLRYLEEHPEVYSTMETLAIRMEKGYEDIIGKYDLPLTVVRFKAMVCLFFAKGNMRSYEDVAKCDTDLYAKYFRGMLENGVLIPPAQFEGYFLSSAHTEKHIDETLTISEKVLKDLFNK